MPDTLFRPGENCAEVAHADRVSFVIDAENYFRIFMRAAERAQRSIVMLGWDFDSRTPLALDASGKPLLLGEFLNGIARKKRSLRIHILGWDFPAVFGTYSTFFGCACTGTAVATRVTAAAMAVAKATLRRRIPIGVLLFGVLFFSY